ncbi:Outer membrane protein assembly factor BamA [Buchnera aphidicola (Pterocallis alni)]|uniref:outer membrane protein assembly factor BamA n=1 Tax=Buchnera aphidicola TaxID=9 RepID=UPI003464AC4A
MKIFIIHLMTLFFFLSYSIIGCADINQDFNKIEFDGLNKFSHYIMYKSLNIKHNQFYYLDNIKKNFSKLFKTGTVDDIRIVKVKNRIFIQFKINNILSNIHLSGNKEINSAIIYDLLNSIGIKKNHFLNIKLLNLLKKTIQKKYNDIGLYNTHVNINYRILNKHFISLEINITEGKYKFLKDIIVSGNKVLDDKKIMSFFSFRTKNAKKVLVINPKYDISMLRADINNLKNFYYKNGYVDFYIKSIKFILYKKENNFVIRINIDEGNQYNISFLRLKGHLLNYMPVFHDNFAGLYYGKVYNFNEITNIKNKLNNIFYNLGFLKFKIFVIPVFDKKSKHVYLDFDIHFGKRFIINTIKFQGNNITKNFTLYNIIKNISVGSYVDLNLIKKDQENLQNINYLQDISYALIKSKNSDNKVDVIYYMNENKLNTINYNVKYNFSDGFHIDCTVIHKNWMGFGITSQVHFIGNKNTQDISLELTCPYIVNNMNFTGNIIYSLQHKSSVKAQAYLHFLISDKQNSMFGIEYVQNNISQYNNVVYTYHTFKWFSSHFNNTIINHIFKSNIIVNYNWNYNSIPGILFPTCGKKISFNGKISFPNIYDNFHKESIYIEQYAPICKKINFILHSRLYAGLGFRFDQNSLPKDELFYINDQNSMRGFLINNIEKSTSDINNKQGKDSHVNNHNSTKIVGKNSFIISKLDLIIPNIFFHTKYNDNFRTSLFMDCGNIWNTNWKHLINIVDNKLENDPLPKNIYFSTGIDIKYLSPIGLLGMSYSYPILYPSQDCLEPLQFHMNQNW